MLRRPPMRRWIVDLGAVALLAAGAVIFSVGNVGWPDYWATVVSALAGMGALRYVLLATVFMPFLVRAWAGRDSYNGRGGDAFILLGINLVVVAAVVWLVATLPRAILLAAVVIGIQGAFTYQAWRRARSLRPR
jgi:uncharacterized membrane protein